MHRELKIVFVEPSTLMFSPCAPYYPANSPPATKFIFLECIFQQPARYKSAFLFNNTTGTSIAQLTSIPGRSGGLNFARRALQLATHLSR